MEEKKIICITCPLGCEVTVRGRGEAIAAVEGHACKRGEAYARGEFAHPVRILTSSVAVAGSAAPLVPVRSAQPLPKEMLMDCMAVLRGVRALAPVAVHDVIVPNILGTGVDMVATGSA